MAQEKQSQEVELSKADRARAQKARTAIRRAQAVSMRAAGATYSAIGDELGVGAPRAYEIVQAGLKDLASEVRGDADKLRALELRRIDTLFALAWRDLNAPQAPNRIDVKVGQFVLRLIERRCALLGLDQKQSASVELSGKVQHDHRIDRSQVEGKTAAEIASMYAQRVAAFRGNGSGGNGS